MRVRRIARVDGKNIIVWFGSYGTNANGSAKFFNPSNIHDNFSENQDYTADLLTQKLSNIKNELWWNVTFGLPLIDKLTSRVEIDAEIGQIILAEESVIDILNFESSFIGHTYLAKIKILTKFGEINLDFDYPVYT